MGKKYLIDSNAVIDALTANYPEKGLIFIREVIDSEINISSVTKIEILGFTDENEKYLKERENFIAKWLYANYA